MATGEGLHSPVFLKIHRRPQIAVGGFGEAWFKSLRELFVDSRGWLVSASALGVGLDGLVVGTGGVAVGADESSVEADRLAGWPCSK